MISLESILKEHFTRYPALEPVDIVKLLHQNTFGPAHFGGSVSLEEATRRIVEECEDMSIYEKTPHLEVIGCGYVRVSLAAVSKKRFRPENLATAFLESMRTGEGSTRGRNTVASRLQWFESLIEQNRFLLEGDIEGVIRRYLDSGCRPVRHSETYRNRYHPHYRVVHERFLRHLEPHPIEGSESP